MRVWDADLFNQLNTIGEDLDKLCKQPVFEQGNIENARAILSQYQTIGSSLENVKTIAVTACERLIGFILQPEYVDNAKSQYKVVVAGSMTLRHRGMQQRMAQSRGIPYSAH